AAAEPRHLRPRGAHRAVLRAHRGQHAERPRRDRLRVEPAGGAPAAHGRASAEDRAQPARGRAGLPRLPQPHADAAVDRPGGQIYSGLGRQPTLTLARLAALAAENVTWIKVDRPTFDLVGVVLTSLSLAGICALVTLTLGAVLGLGFIVRGRRDRVPV